mmetsp:Transcript_2589/g.3530  ORF Transcript_2589/g.3530 Transcript_2589/m.3530 type:complete len:179 (+) Transcript_2589:1216-1752(+)
MCCFLTRFYVFVPTTHVRTKCSMYADKKKEEDIDLDDDDDDDDDICNEKKEEKREKCRENIDLSQMPARSQWGLYWTVQTHYTDHNTSATIEFREDEIDELSKLIHDGIGHGYISAALFARFDSSVTFPRMPIEPISRERYNDMMKEVESRRVSDNFGEMVARRDKEVAMMMMKEKAQ